MIPPESKAKLEEMARKESQRQYPGQYESFLDPYWYEKWLNGATAAWKMATELAVKAERQRIIDKLTYQCECCDLNKALNPPKDEAEK